MLQVDFIRGKRMTCVVRLKGGGKTGVGCVTRVLVATNNSIVGAVESILRAIPELAVVGSS